MPKFERSGSGEEEWIEPARRRPRKGPPKQDKGGRNAALLTLSRVHGVPATQLAAWFEMPVSTVRSALNAAKEKGRRRKASRPAPDDDEG
jgi:hypothetical protein